MVHFAEKMVNLNLFIEHELLWIKIRINFIFFLEWVFSNLGQITYDLLFNVQKVFNKSISILVTHAIEDVQGSLGFQKDRKEFAIISFCEKFEKTLEGFFIPQRATDFFPKVRKHLSTVTI